MTTDVTTHDPRLALPLLGQWALVTGASKGIGFAIAEEFVRAGANVVLVARHEDVLKEAADEIKAILRKYDIGASFAGGWGLRDIGASHAPLSR